MKSKKAISLIIIVWITLQLYAGVRFHQRSWPFVGYTMFAESYGPGDKIEMFHLYGYTASGERREIFAEDFGLWRWPFSSQIQPKLLNPQTRASCASELLSLYNEKHASERLDRLEAVMEYRIVTQQGTPELRFETLIVQHAEKQTSSEEPQNPEEQKK